MPASRFTLHMGVLVLGAAALLFALWQCNPPEDTATPKGVQTHERHQEPSPSMSAPPSRTTPSLPEVLGTLDATLRQNDLQNLARELGRTDPTRGWGMLASIAGMGDREAFATNLLQAWAENDLNGALATCKTLPAGQLRASCHAAVMTVWARSAPASAADWARTQLTGSARQAALTAVTRVWAQQDANAAARWAQTQGETSSGLAAISEVMTHWANTDPQAGATWSASLPAGPFRENALQAVVSEWADQYPAEAAAWVQATPDAAAQSDQVAQIWASHDPAPASEWALALNDPAQRHSTALIAFTTWAAAAPKEALTRAQTIRDESLRQEITASIIEVWQLDDPAAVQVWQAAQPQKP